MNTAAATLPQALPQDTNTAKIKQDRDQIERVTYLASLASNYQAIDAMMDALRSVTADWDGTSPLSSAQTDRLRDLEGRLTQYLITKDPVRTFTADSLAKQLDAHAGRHPLRSVRLSLLGVVGSSLLAAGAPFLVPSFSREESALLGIPLFFVVLHIGISWLYLSALKNFQEEVRRAFQLICVGVILFGAVFSHYAAISAFHLESQPLFKDAGITWIVALPFIFFFFGLRLYAKQVQVKTRLLSPWFVLVVVIAGAALSIGESLLSSPTSSITPLEGFLVIGGRMIDVFAAIGSIMAWKIRKVVAPAYARPMTWMFAYLFLSFVASMLSGILFISGSFEGESGATESMPFYLFMALAGLPVQLLLMWTGYVFKREVSK